MPIDAHMLGHRFDFSYPIRDPLTRVHFDSQRSSPHEGLTRSRLRVHGHAMRSASQLRALTTRSASRNAEYGIYEKSGRLKGATNL